MSPTEAGIEDHGDVGSDGEEIKEQELAHLKRLHSVDKFPLAADFEVIINNFCFLYDDVCKPLVARAMLIVIWWSVL